ncbi:MAG: hypothetical protein ACOX2Q_10150 [Dehalobacterium sp.]|jgi:hypothetical protein
MIPWIDGLLTKGYEEAEAEKAMSRSGDESGAGRKVSDLTISKEAREWVDLGREYGLVPSVEELMERQKEKPEK